MRSERTRISKRRNCILDIPMWTGTSSHQGLNFDNCEAQLLSHPLLTMGRPMEGGVSGIF